MNVRQLNVVPCKASQLIEPLRTQIMEGNQLFGWSIEQSEADFSNENAEYYVLVEQSQVIGYVGLHIILDESTVNVLYVRPDERQQGFAFQLMDFVLGQLYYRDIRHVFLEVRQSNGVAQHLYRKLGFIPLTTRRQYYHNPTEDAVIMQYQCIERENK